MNYSKFEIWLRNEVKDRNHPTFLLKFKTLYPFIYKNFGRHTTYWLRKNPDKMNNILNKHPDVRDWVQKNFPTWKGLPHGVIIDIVGKMRSYKKDESANITTTKGNL